MFRLIVNFFNGIASLFRGTSMIVQEAGKSVEKSVEAFSNIVDETLEASKASKARAIEKYKKEKAQMVIDEGYESEEAMDKAHDELLKSLKKKHR